MAKVKEKDIKIRLEDVNLILCDKAGDQMAIVHSNINGEIVISTSNKRKVQVQPNGPHQLQVFVRS